MIEIMGLEILSLVLALISLVYIYGLIELTKGDFKNSWKILFVANLIFIAIKLVGIVNEVKPVRQANMIVSILCVLFPLMILLGINRIYRKVKLVDHELMLDHKKRKKH